MKRYLIILCLLLCGCNEPTLSKQDFLSIPRDKVMIISFENAGIKRYYIVEGISEREYKRLDIIKGYTK